MDTTYHCDGGFVCDIPIDGLLAPKGFQNLLRHIKN